MDLGTFRSTVLNYDLGLATDTDTGNDARFGTKADRNRAIARAIERLWPECARLVRETVTLVTGQTDYTLTTVRDINAIEVLDSSLDPDRVVRDYSKWRAWVDESTPASVVSRLSLYAPMDATRFSLRVIGYVAYAIPSVDADVLDFPAGMNHIVSAGARAAIYLARTNQFMDFEQLRNTDRATTLSPEQIITLWRAAETEFEDGKRAWPRGAADPRVATFARRQG